MFRKFSCLLVALITLFTFTSANLAGVSVYAEDEDTYTVITSTSKVLTSGNYKLTSDVTLSNGLQINSGVEVTLDLNGYTLSTNYNYVILVYNGVLNLIDSSVDGSGVVENKSTLTRDGITISTGGIVNMSGGTVKGSYGISFASNSNGVLNITGGTVIGTKYHGIYIYNGYTYIKGTDEVVITSQTTSSSYYGIYSYASTLEISNPNTYVSAPSSKAVYKNQNSSINMSITAGYYSSDVTKYVLEGYSCKDSGNSSYPYVVSSDTVEEEPEVVLPVLYGRALTLDGKVGVTFYFDMTGVSDPENYRLVAKIGEDGDEQTVSMSESKVLDDIEYYRYTVYVKPNEFNTTISAYLVDETDEANVTQTYTYSVYEYCMNAINNNWTDEIDLCEALLNYGDYATAYDSEADVVSSLASVSDWSDPVAGEWVDLSEYEIKPTEGVVKTILLGDSVVIRLYLTSAVASENDVFTVDGTTLELHELTDEAYAYYIEFPVPAKNMCDIFTIKKNGEDFTAYSVLTYVYNIIENSSDESLVNLCKAIYYYSKAASEYKGWL